MNVLDAWLLVRTPTDNADRVFDAGSKTLFARFENGKYHIYCLRIIRFKRMSASRQPSKSCYFTPEFIFNFHIFSEEGWSSRSTTESKNQAEASQAAAKAGKRCRAAKKAKLNYIPALEKTNETMSCEWNIQKGPGKVDRWQLRVEERSGSTAPDTPLIRYRLGRSGKKGTELPSQVEKLSQKLSS